MKKGFQSISLNAPDTFCRGDTPSDNINHWNNRSLESSGVTRGSNQYSPLEKIDYVLRETKKKSRDVSVLDYPSLLVIAEVPEWNEGVHDAAPIGADDKVLTSHHRRDGPPAKSTNYQ
jgi:hypothetical protein